VRCLGVGVGVGVGVSVGVGGGVGARGRERAASVVRVGPALPTRENRAREVGEGQPGIFARASRASSA